MERIIFVEMGLTHLDSQFGNDGNWRELSKG